MIRDKGRTDTNRGKTDRVCDNYQGQIREKIEGEPRPREAVAGLRPTTCRRTSRADNPYFSPLPIFGWKTEFLSITYNRIPHKTSRPYLRSEHRHNERLLILYRVGLLLIYGFSIILTTVYAIY